MTARNREPGSVLRIPLGHGRFGYGRLLKGPLVEFFDLQSIGRSRVPDVEEIIRSPGLFRINVMNLAVNRWKLLGVVPLSDEERGEVYRFFKQDSISGALSIYWSGPEEASYGEIRATLEGIQDLERLSVWSDHHVKDRLRDHFDGRPCVWGRPPQDPAEWRR